MKYLIADDDPRIRRMLKAVLAEPGIEFIEAQDGGEAVALHQRHRPDLVILDIDMKPMDGIAAARLIRATDAQCRMLIVSQYDSPGFRQAATAAGAFGYVLKENMENIPAVVSQHLRPPT